MNKNTLLVVMSHPEANPIVARHAPFWRLSGCDILGVGRTDGQCLWPECVTHQVDVGVASGPVGDNHLVRYLKVLEHCLGELKQYDDYCVIEYDAITVRPIPNHPEEGAMCCLLAGHREPESDFRASNYYHCPWWVDRWAALNVLHCGRRMLNTNLLEYGLLDRWFGLMFELFPNQIKPTEAPAYSRNTLDSPVFIEEAREAIRKGAVFVHGLKTTQQLSQLTEGLVTV